MKYPSIQTIQITAFQDQKPGTSGLRKKLSVFKQQHYLEAYIQSIFLVLSKIDSIDSLLLGGDGREYMHDALQSIIRMALANKVKKIYVAENGLLSTPAASHLVRVLGVNAAIILSASHNPGGIAGDFGVKLNLSHGGPASFNICEKIYQQARTLTEYYTTDDINLALNTKASLRLVQSDIQIIDTVNQYANLMESCFDFPMIRSALSSNKVSFYFDAMHAVTGPYAVEIFSNRLGLPERNILNKKPLSDFGGFSPDPLPHKLQHLQAFVSDNSLGFAAASDGDGDRHLIIHNAGLAHPADLLALMAHFAEDTPQFANGLRGVARTMPTSRALDYVASKKGIPKWEVPTGWKFFVNLLEASKVGICGEESFGIGGSHHREKDGLWSILFILSLVCQQQKSLQTLLFEHWKTYGRHYFARCDYKGISIHQMDAIWKRINQQLSGVNKNNPPGVIESAGQWDYYDEIDGVIIPNQGFQVLFENGDRVVLRFSGTDTERATLRAYFEHYEPKDGIHITSVEKALEPLRTWIEAELQLGIAICREFIG